VAPRRRRTSAAGARRPAAHTCTVPPGRWSVSGTVAVHRSPSDHSDCRGTSASGC
jgi:hypothetical protein